MTFTQAVNWKKNIEGTAHVTKNANKLTNASLSNVAGQIKHLAGLKNKTMILIISYNKWENCACFNIFSLAETLDICKCVERLLSTTECSLWLGLLWSCLCAYYVRIFRTAAKVQACVQASGALQIRSQRQTLLQKPRLYGYSQRKEHQIYEMCATQ